MALIDISRPISPATAVWPGDQEVEWTWTRRIGQDDAPVNLGALQCSAHAGTHVDAPYHVREEGETTDNLPLSVFVGPAMVIDVTGSSSIQPEHVEGVDTERVLFKTDASSLSAEEWPETITAFDPDTIHRLADSGTKLIGTDAPSVDPLDSTDLPAHHALVETGIVNLEGLCLDGVSPGQYVLTALPLKIAGGDAAPVRAVLEDSSLD